MDLLSVIASSRRRLDPLVVAYAAESGATDLAAIDAIIKYVRSQSLLSNFRLYPMKSAQNAGTGTTVYGAGSLSSVNATLVNGPTWNEDGIAFDGTDDHATVAIVGAKDYAELSWGVRLKPTSASVTDPAIQVYLFQGDNAETQLSFFGNGTLSLTGERLVLGFQNQTSNRKGNTTFAWSASEDITLSANMRTVSMSGDSATIPNNLTTGSATNYAPDQETSTIDGFYIGAAKNGAGTLGQFDGKMLAAWFCNAALTDAQRHQIDTLVSAL